MKIELDKYYTPIEVANHCWEIVEKYVEFSTIKRIIEPSVGSGAFCNWKIKPNLMIDIKPQYENAIQVDFLTYPLKYEKGTLVIGNPPYGDRLKLARDFFNKSCDIADYIGFILPISQLNNTTSFYRFDLIYSEDLGIKSYSGVNLHCCFNLYKRPSGGEHKFKKEHFEGVTFYRQDRKDYASITDYDLRMCYWGNGSVGKILSDDEKYSGEYKIKIDDRHPQKQEILKILKETDWKNEVKGIAMARLKQYMIFEKLRECGIEELKIKEESLFDL